MAADGVIMAFNHRRFILDTSRAYGQLNISCLTDLDSFLTALTVADCSLKIVLATSKLQDSHAVRAGCNLTCACAGIGHGRALYRCASRVNNRYAHLVGQAHCQYNIGNIRAIDVDSGFAVGLIRIAIRSFVDSRQVEGAIRHVHPEATIVTGRCFDRLGLVIAVYNGHKCICKPITVIVYDNTCNHVLLAGIRFRAIGLENQILSGISQHINRYRITGVASSSRIQCIAACLGCGQADAIRAVFAGIHST